MQRDAEYKAPREIDVKVIEAVVNRILRDREESSPEKAAIVAPDQQTKKMPHATEDISFDDALEALGSDGLNAVAGALEMFRKK